MFFYRSLSSARKTHTVARVWLLSTHMCMCIVGVSVFVVYVCESARKRREGVCLCVLGGREGEREKERRRGRE